LQNASVKKSRTIIGRIIKYQRMKIGLTQKELADRMEIDKQYIWKIENGKINISPDYLDKVIDKLGVKHEDFFNISDIKEN
jgi:transcriptional regulator with XRE-family HTH domain